MHPFWKLIQPFGIDLFCMGKKFLVFNLVSRNLKVKYRRSFFGFFWTLLSPLAMSLVYYYVFKVIMNNNTPHYLPFILSGVLPWAFFSSTVIEAMESLVGNIGVLTKVPVPLQVFPYVGAITNGVTLVLSLPILLGAVSYSQLPVTWSWLFLPVLLGLLFLMSYSVGLMLSIFFVFLRDLRHIMGIVMQIWFYATPILYDESFIPEKIRFVLWLNPVAHCFSGIHRILIAGLPPTGDQWLGAVAWTAGLLVCAIGVHVLMGRELVEAL
jgi:ABC-type polysaccharide/polyol phosphate export permease